MCSQQECMLGVLGRKDALNAEIRRAGYADDRVRRRGLQSVWPLRLAVNLDLQRQFGPSQWSKMVRWLDERHLFAGLDEACRTKLVMGTTRFSREEIEIDEAACSTWIAEREFGTLHQHERSIATIPDPFEKRSGGQHCERGNPRFYRQELREGSPDQVAAERHEWSESVCLCIFGRDAGQQGIDGRPQVVCEARRRVG